VKREVSEYLSRLRPVLGKKADRLWALYLSSDRDQCQRLEAVLALLDLKYNRTGPSEGPPPLPPPEPGVLDGWLRLGHIAYPGRGQSPFGLNPSELIQHVGIFGRSGAGKTNTVMVLLRSLLDRGVPFLIFDWKRNYRDLLAAPWVPEGSIAAFTAGRDLAPLHLNPLRPPPGTEARIWLKKIIEILAHAYFLGEGVMYLLQEAIDQCYEKAGVYSGSDNYPTFRDVHTYLKHRKVIGREANWMASTLRTTGALTFGHMADTVCSDHPNDISELLKGNVVLELDALTDTDKIFLVETLMLHIHHLRLAEPGREKLKHVLVIEEAHHVFLKAKQEIGGGEPITDVILREIRELGEAVVLIDQHPSQIAITALGNTYCTIAMNLKHRFDVGTIADACLLEPDQKDHLGRLPVGRAVVKLQDRWVSPFMVDFPMVSITKGAVSDNDLRGLNRSTKVEHRFSKIRPPQPACPEIPERPAPPKRAAEEPDLRRFMEDIVNHSASGVTDRYTRLRLSRRKGTNLKRMVTERGLAKEIHVPLPGGRVTLLEATEEGHKWLDRPRQNPRSGGAIHKFWIGRLATEFKKRGHSVKLEVPTGNGQAIDLVACKHQMTTAIEVEVSGRRLDSSLAKLSAFDGGRRVIACASTPMLERARTKIRSTKQHPEIQVAHVWSVLANPEASKKPNLSDS